jgi:hypothetical protein
VFAEVGERCYDVDDFGAAHLASFSGSPRRSRRRR